MMDRPNVYKPTSGPRDVAGQACPSCGEFVQLYARHDCPNDAPAGVADMARVMNPHGLQAVGDQIVATCKLCGGAGRREAFICSACGGAGLVRVR